MDIMDWFEEMYVAAFVQIVTQRRFREKKYLAPMNQVFF